MYGAIAGLSYLGDSVIRAIVIPRLSDLLQIFQSDNDIAVTAIERNSLQMLLVQVLGKYENYLLPLLCLSSTC